MKHIFLLLLLLVAGGTVTWGQGRTITGVVVDDKGLGVPSAGITVKGTTTGTVTDFDGNFRLAVPEGGTTLVIQGLGYNVIEVPITNTMRVRLTSASTQLTGTIVTALGIRRSERSVGYATQQLKSDQFENARDGNVVNAIAGKVAGVRVNTQSGGVGGSSKIVIRGSSSLSISSQPLFVIDGVPISNSATDLGSAGQGVGIDYGNRIGDLNPDDIESMNVLKGPAATAAYGTLAKDGAIIITTKRGAKNTALQVSVNSSYRLDNVLVKPDLQSEFAQGNYGRYDLKYANGWGPRISEVQNQTFKDYLGRDVTLQGHPDNVKNFFQTGQTWINDVALSGGGDKSDYRISLGAFNTKGIVPNQKLDRYNLGANVGYQFNSKWSSRISFAYTRNTSKGRPVQSSNSPNVLTSAIYSIPTTVDVRDLEEHFQNNVGEQNNLTTDKAGNNPYWILNKNINSNQVDRLFGAAYLEFKPTSWLTISDNLGLDYTYESRREVVRQGTAGNLKGSFNDGMLYNRRINNDLIATAQGDVTKDLNLKVMIGNNILDRYYTENTVRAQNLTIDELYRYSNAESSTPDNYLQQWRLYSFYGEFTTSYKSLLYLTFTGRNDWSSTLPKYRPSYFYPSVTGSLIFSDLIRKNDFLTYGKLRAGWANVGSDPNPYSLDNYYSAARQYYLQYFTNNNTFPHGGQSGFTGPRIIPNPDLLPQIATSVEFGTDLRFFHNRISLDLTYYNTKTRNQIIAIDVPLSTGYFAKYINAGMITNKGFEAILGISPFKSAQGFSWDITGNFSRNKQIVNDLNGDLGYYAIESGWSGLQVKARVGGGFALYGGKWKRAPDGQFVINPNTGLRLVETDQYLGDINPDFMLGINNRFSFKGLSLSFLIDIRQGGVFYSGTVANLRANGMAEETTAGRDGTFIDKGVNEVSPGVYQPNTTPVQSMQDFWNNYSNSSYTEGSVFDASFVKLREVTLGYALPAGMFSKSRVIKGLFIGLEGRNLWLISSHVPHVDPELNFFGTGSTGDGVEFNSFPTTRTYGINLKLKL